MTTIEQSIFIKAAPEAVTAVTENASHMTEWFDGLEKIDAGDEWPSAGSTAEVHFKSAGITFKSLFTSLEFVSGGKMTAKIEGMSTGTNSWDYEAHDGGTTVFYKLDYELSGGAIGQAVDKIIVERSTEKSIEKTLKNLKAMVEG